MTAAGIRRLLLIILLLLAVSGLLIHIRAHPFRIIDALSKQSAADRNMLAATILPLIDVVLVTLLYCSRKTAVYGYLLNGLLVIYGTVLMGHFSLAVMPAGGTLAGNWMIRSTLPDISVAWADFLVGKLLYDSWVRETDPGNRLLNQPAREPHFR